MKLTKTAVGNALCPVCALNGEVRCLQMPVDSLIIACQNGHTFDPVYLTVLRDKADHGA